MSRLLMNLRLVPDDEADAVRDLLDAQGIDWYEIAPNRWGVSSGAIWIRDDEDHPRASELLARFQEERRREARETHARERREGTASFIGNVRREPVQALVALACILLMLGLVALPVFLLAP